MMIMPRRHSAACRQRRLRMHACMHVCKPTTALQGAHARHCARAAAGRMAEGTWMDARAHRHTFARMLVRHAQPSSWKVHSRMFSHLRSAAAEAAASRAKVSTRTLPVAAMWGNVPPHDQLMSSDSRRASQCEHGVEAQHSPPSPPASPPALTTVAYSLLV